MIFLILKKELKHFFRSPMAYFVAGLFSMIVGWLFFNQLSYFAENIQKVHISMRTHFDFANEVVLKLFGNVNFLLLFISPIIAMKSFSEEYRSRTIDLLFYSHCSDLEIIIAKYLSLIIQGCFLLSTTLIYPLLLGNLEMSDTTFIVTGYLGLVLNLACFLAMGMFASCVTKNSIIASVLAFVFVLFSWMMAMFSQMSSNFFLAELFKYLSINHHYENFVKANISLADLAFYFSFITIFIIIIKKRLGMRHWT